MELATRPLVSFQIQPALPLSKALQIRYKTAFVDGIVPLNVNALLPHVLEHFPEEGYIRAVNGGLLVDEIAVKAVVLGQLHQLFGVRELTVFILVQPLLGVLGRLWE